ncbi:MAG: zinc dependent phospholipase C family protein [Clostridia bacterium]|nr:zinc dependent phospholipase C family protein [Clostridia bacterium]
MKVKTHYKIAKLVIEKFEFSRRAKIAFYFGNIIPDILPFYHPHYFKRSGKYVFKVLHKLAHKRSIFSFFKRGIMCHYVSDFCCSAHVNGLGIIKEHNAYERALEDYAKENLSYLEQITDKTDRLCELHSVFESYIKGERYDYVNDFCHAVLAGRTVIRRFTPYMVARPVLFGVEFEPLTLDLSAILQEYKKKN